MLHHIDMSPRSLAFVGNDPIFDGDRIPYSAIKFNALFTTRIPGINPTRRQSQRVVSLSKVKPLVLGKQRL